MPRTPKGPEPVFAADHHNGLPHRVEMLCNKQHRSDDFYQRIAIHDLD